ncbi:Hypothetical protein NTJ_00597 [Nesidiocoris tenuis]|uniref:Uncharacterized protein n=1 Tax=Nesidiocoris tenuis TaxID=355587 RepID=A0ABN7A6H1_9HEMI|nr:Hypothetical protein NTJ_00597 [Nesidiocoris tenuis]
MNETPSRPRALASHWSAAGRYGPPIGGFRLAPSPGAGHLHYSMKHPPVAPRSLSAGRGPFYNGNCVTTGAPPGTRGCRDVDPGPRRAAAELRF